MKHIENNELLEYISGRLPDTKEKQLQQHIDECAKCRTRYHETVDVWETLGQWQVDSSNHEIVDHIEALAMRDKHRRRQRRTKKVPLRSSFYTALRVAAAIIIAIGGGHLLGRYSLSRDRPETTVIQEKPRYVAALGFEWSSELTWMALEEEVTPDGVD